MPRGEIRRGVFFESMPQIKILYQDAWVVVVHKPEGYLVHPADEPQPNDLVLLKALRDQLGKRVNAIHRLDRPTSGVLLFAFDSQATRLLQQSLERQEFQKEYQAVVEGEVAEQWECHEPIQKKEGAPFKAAHTSFTRERVVEKDGHFFSLIRAIPHTGRFHQIRRHLLAGGFPIVGDYRYAGIEKSDLLGRLLGTGTRMLLHAERLTFPHPQTGERILVEGLSQNWLADPQIRK